MVQTWCEAATEADVHNICMLTPCLHRSLPPTRVSVHACLSRNIHTYIICWCFDPGVSFEPWCILPPKQVKWTLNLTVMQNLDLIKKLESELSVANSWEVSRTIGHEAGCLGVICAAQAHKMGQWPSVFVEIPYSAVRHLTVCVTLWCWL